MSQNWPELDVDRGSKRQHAPISPLSAPEGSNLWRSRLLCVLQQIPARLLMRSDSLRSEVCDLAARVIANCEV